MFRNYNQSNLPLFTTALHFICKEIIIEMLVV